MPLATGLFATPENPAELNKRSFADAILRLYPNGSAPMFALTSKSGRSKAVSSTHGYFNRSMSFLYWTLGAGYLIGDGTVTLPSTTGIVVGMVLWNSTTNENLRVTGINSSTVIAVTRAFGRQAAVAGSIGHKLYHVGTAYEEGSNRPAARRLTTVYVPNYTQIFRNAWAITDTARASMVEKGFGNISESKRDCAVFHSVDIESAIIWGQPKMDTSGATPLHATQGVIDAIRQYASGNINAAAATTNYAQLVALVDPCFTYSTDMGNPKERVLFGDATAIKVINDVGRLSGQVQLMNSQTEFGMRYTSFNFYRGTINLVEHPLMNGLAQSGVAIIMDMPALKLAYMEGRDTKAEEYGVGGKSADSGQDAVGGSFTTEAAVELINPYSCGMITGLTAGAA